MIDFNSSVYVFEIEHLNTNSQIQYATDKQAHDIPNLYKSSYILSSRKRK